MVTKQFRRGVGEVDDGSVFRQHDPYDADDFAIEVGNPSSDADAWEAAEEFQ